MAARPLESGPWIVRTSPGARLLAGGFFGLDRAARCGFGRIETVGIVCYGNLATDEQSGGSVPARGGAPAGPAGGGVRMRRVSMAIFERPKSLEKLPTDLVAVIRDSGVLNERQLN